MICTVLGDTKMKDPKQYLVGLISAILGAIATYVTQNGFNLH